MCPAWTIRHAALVALLVVITGCGATVRSTFRVADRPPTSLPGIDCCDDFRCQAHRLDPHRPATILIHGCKTSSSRLQALRQIFEAHGEQAVCFSYDDRATIAASADQLRRALIDLAGHLPGQRITLLGHSQGGLVARTAVTADGVGPRLPRESGPIRLVSVSSPFNGITAASHCAHRFVHVLSLGLTAGLCHSITGAKWFEIHPRAEPVVAPKPLADVVREHVLIATDETGSCRRRNADGSCVEDDFVFSLDEQLNPHLLEDPRVTSVTVKAGHAAIVGDDHRPPLVLRELLQQQAVLPTLSAAADRDVRSLMAQLY